MAAAFWDSTTETLTVADTTNGGWSAAGGPQQGIGGLAAFRLQMFYFLSGAGGSDTVTATRSVSGTVTLAIHEYSSTVGTVTVDGTPAYNTPTGADPVTSAAVTTTVTDALLFLTGISGDQMAAVAPFTQRQHANFGNNLTADWTTSGAPGSKTGQGDITSSSDPNVMGLVAFKEGGAPAVVGVSNRYLQRHSRMTSW